MGRVTSSIGRAVGGITRGVSSFGGPAGRAIGDVAGRAAGGTPLELGALKSKLQSSVAKTAQKNGIGSVDGVLSKLKPPIPGHGPLPQQAATMAHSLASQGGIGLQSAKQALQGNQITNSLGAFKASKALRDL